MPVIDATPPPLKKTPAAPRPAKNSPLLKERTEALAAFGALAQVPLLATRLYADAGAVGQYWPPIAAEIAKLADVNEQIAGVIDPLIKVGPYTGLITAVLPFVMQIAVNHGRMAPGAMGTVPASLLQSQIETALAQAELEALRIQHDAEQASRKMKADMEAERKMFSEAASD